MWTGPWAASLDSPFLNICAEQEKVWLCSRHPCSTISAHKHVSLVDNCGISPPRVLRDQKIQHDSYHSAGVFSNRQPSSLSKMFSLGGTSHLESTPDGAARQKPGHLKARFSGLPVRQRTVRFASVRVVTTSSFIKQPQSLLDSHCSPAITTSLLTRCLLFPLLLIAQWGVMNVPWGAAVVGGGAKCRFQASISTPGLSRAGLEHSSQSSPVTLV